MNHQRLSTDRISAIRRSGLLDQKGSEQFGYLTEHVRASLEVPVAIISIVDEDRQIFAGHCGLPEPWASRGETPLTHSFCQHVVASNAPFIVRNAHVDELVMENQAIADLGVVAYLGVPIHLPTGELVGALAAIDTTSRDWTTRDRRSLETLAKVVEKEISLGVSELKYRSLFADMQEGYYVASAVKNKAGALVDMVFEDVNPAFERLTGLTPAQVVGSRLSQLVPDALGDMLPAYDRVLNTGEPLLHSNGTTRLGGRWYENRIRRLDSERVASIFNDVTDRKQAEAQQQLVNGEMGHRLKNMLAMVQAIASQTLRPVTERSYVEAFEKRLHALSLAQDVLLLENRDTASLAELVTATLLRLIPSDRLTMDGPEIQVGPRAALSFSLLLHELGTNAVKYGAISNAAGHVSLRWHFEGSEGSEVFHLDWLESDGPPVREPAGRGFGSKLIRMGLVGTGGVEVSYAPTGFHATMTAPLEQLKHAG